MRRLVLLCLVFSSLVPAGHAAAAPERSWAQQEIQTVVEAGLLADDVATFEPQKPLTQRALADALETLSSAGEEPAAAAATVARLLGLRTNHPPTATRSSSA